MCKDKRLLITCVLVICSPVIWGADVILNEYNAVNATGFLNGGNAAVDAEGGRASDIYFGRIRSNGGNWFELAVITDHLNMRNWHLDIYEGGTLDETLDLTNHAIWSDLRSGTIITVSEDLPSDISYNPAAGDWWINVQAEDNADGQYIEDSSFPVSASNWQLRIRNATGTIIFGPAGEGVSPATGVGDTEICRLETDPSASITPLSNKYDSGKDFSTFGAPNRWGIQDFSQLRTVAPGASTLSLSAPNGSEIIMAGTIYTIRWTSQGTIYNVLTEFSIDNGKTWLEVYPANIGNTGAYEWFVPAIDSEQCLVRISSATNLRTYDVSNGPNTIYQCVLPGDLTGDCLINLFDLAIMASDWLECANPYNPSCN
jgi:hypothetical protein